MRNKFLREKTEANSRAYNIQRNYCVSLIRKTKRDYYSNLKHNQVTGVRNEKITMIENGETLSKKEKIDENLNNFFSDIITFGSKTTPR